jgi:translation elongation factor EF-G
VVDVKVTLFFGSYHDVDSNENVPHGRFDGIQGRLPQSANPVILEPMMAVEVETPEDYAGTVMGDLSSRRGMVQGMDEMAAAARSSRPKCRCRKCSVTRPRCVPQPKVVQPTPWNSSTTPKRLSTLSTQSLPRKLSNSVFLRPGRSSGRTFKTLF